MAPSRPLFIGMDVHKDAIAGAYGAPEHDAEVLSLDPSGTRQDAIDQRVRKRQATATPLGFVYEAGPVTPGSPALERPKTTPAGSWSPPSCPQRPGTASQRTGGPPCHWPGWPARAPSRRAMCPTWKMTLSGLAVGRVTIPSAIAKTPRCASKRAGSGTTSALRVGPPGAPPTCGGSPQSCVRPRRSTVSSRNLCAPCPSPPHVSSVWSKHSTSRAKPGGSRLWSTPCRPCAGCRA
jgi:hypothetical protein